LPNKGKKKKEKEKEASALLQRRKLYIVLRGRPGGLFLN
jgi:hypothetical protein